MKKTFFMLFLLPLLPLFSCNSNEKKDAPESENNFPAAPNAIGNIPDTTNSINLGNKTDSSSSNDSLAK